MKKENDSWNYINNSYKAFFKYEEDDNRFIDFETRKEYELYNEASLDTNEAIGYIAPFKEAIKDQESMIRISRDKLMIELDKLNNPEKYIVNNDFSGKEELINELNDMLMKLNSDNCNNKKYYLQKLDSIKTKARAYLI